MQIYYFGQPKMPVKKDAIKNTYGLFHKNFSLFISNGKNQSIYKYALVLGLNNLGNVVAVTDDGTIDAPALSKSDVGFSMNDESDIAKEDGDII